ncbi:MAG: nicotinate phosphoribosyltransferase, partial [Christensenellaceae bacterium]|nr:nicotinate phosphoribosyltransferase [Christensenellaceae bacterium]
SSDLDEQIIRELKQQGARIDVWGVGTKLITSENCPALGGVYKLAAMEQEDGTLRPKINVSENTWKITNPGYKKVVRLYQGSTGKAIADLIMLAHETIDESKPLTIFHPVETWKKTTLTDFYAKELLVPVFENGKAVYESPSVREIREYSLKDLDTFWDEYRRFTKPHLYKVDLSDELYQLKKDMLNGVHSHE